MTTYQKFLKARMSGARVEGLPDAEYRADPAVSCSKIKSIYSGGCAAFGLLKDTKTTDALAQGAALHIATTRPECFEDEVVIAPEGTGYGKRDNKKFLDFAKDHEGKTIILAKETRLIDVCSRAARTHPKIKKFLDAGVPEVSYFAHNEEFGADVKCRVDWEKNGGDWCIDFKFMRAASEHKWKYDSRNLGYYIQDAFYQHVVSLVRGKVPSRFTFVVIDKELALRLDKDKLPIEWAVAIYEHDERDLDGGAEAWRYALGLWTEYLEAKEAGIVWAGFPDKAQTVRVTWGDE